MLFLAAAFACSGCATLFPPERAVLIPGGAGWHGVVLRQLEESGSRVDVLDVDLRTPGIQLEIASEDPRVGGSALAGQARTVAEWVSATAALGGVNGGFFGR